MWTEEDKKLLENATTYVEIGKIALNVMKRMGDTCIVSGPISTGGKGNIKDNLEAFNKTIQKLLEKGEHVFTQMPMEDALQRLKKRNPNPDALLEGSYRCLFESGYVKKIFFIHGWESSYGANWEHDIAKKNNIEIIDLPEGFEE